jgi:hypothetical protein
LIGIGRISTFMTLCIEGVWRIFDDILQIFIYTRHSFLSAAQFERCVLSDMKIKGICVSPALSVD